MTHQPPRVPSPATLGQVVRSVAVPGFVVTECRYRGGAAHSEHTHRRASLFAVVRGTARETVAGVSYTCNRFGVLAKPAGTVHSNVYGQQGARAIVVEVGRAVEGRTCSDLFASASYHPGGAASWVGARLWHELQVLDEASALAVEGLCLELLAACGRLGTGGRREPHWIGDVHAFIVAHPAARLSVGRLADLFNVAPTTLARTFRRRYGLGIADHVRRARLELVMDLLLRTDRPLARISQQAGYYDQSHLSNAFKRLTGLTPTQFRAQRRLQEE